MKVINYEKQQDFSLISTIYNLDNEALELLTSILTQDTLNLLKPLTSKIYENHSEFTQSILKYLGKELWEVHQETICQCCDLGRRKFYAKLGWVLNYQHDIYGYAEILTLIRSVQIQLKTQGLYCKSLTEWMTDIKTDSLTPRGQKVQQQIIPHSASYMVK